MSLEHLQCPKPWWPSRSPIPRTGPLIIGPWRSYGKSITPKTPYEFLLCPHIHSSLHLGWNFKLNAGFRFELIMFLYKYVHGGCSSWILVSIKCSRICWFICNFGCERSEDHAATIYASSLIAIIRQMPRQLARSFEPMLICTFSVLLLRFPLPTPTTNPKPRFRSHPKSFSYTNKLSPRADATDIQCREPAIVHAIRYVRHGGVERMDRTTQPWSASRPAAAAAPSGATSRKRTGPTHIGQSDTV